MQQIKNFLNSVKKMINESGIVRDERDKLLKNYYWNSMKSDKPSKLGQYEIVKGKDEMGNFIATYAYTDNGVIKIEKGFNENFHWTYYDGVATIKKNGQDKNFYVNLEKHTQNIMLFNSMETFYEDKTGLCESFAGAMINLDDKSKFKFFNTKNNLGEKRIIKGKYETVLTGIEAVENLQQQFDEIVPINVQTNIEQQLNELETKEFYLKDYKNFVKTYVTCPLSPSGSIDVKEEDKRSTMIAYDSKGAIVIEKNANVPYLTTYKGVATVNEHGQDKEVFVNIDEMTFSTMNNSYERVSGCLIDKENEGVDLLNISKLEDGTFDENKINLVTTALNDLKQRFDAVVKENMLTATENADEQTLEN